MQIANSNRTWGAVQQGFHWFIVIAVISQLTIGLSSPTCRRKILAREPCSAYMRRWAWSSFSSCWRASLAAGQPGAGTARHLEAV